MKKIRESNFELMRIISMFFIVLFHTLSYSGYLGRATGGMYLLVTFIKSITLVHVNSFILLCGYFQCKQKLKLGKVISLINATWFYKAGILLLFLACGWLITNPPTTTEILRTILPLDYGLYWFIGNYIVLYLISPILNIVINNTTKQQLRNVIIILLVIVSGLSLVTVDSFYNNNYGRSLSTFILLYFVGAYLRNYPIDQSYFMKPFTITAKRTVWFLTMIVCAVIGTMCCCVSQQIIDLGSVSQEIGHILDYLFSSYSSPFVLLQTLCYFMLFASFTFKNKIINAIAGCTIGVYLIHENKYIRENFYDFIGITNITNIDLKAIAILFAIVIGMFVVCTIIEFIRKNIFKFVYNSKLAIKNREKYQAYFEKLGLNINW